MSYGQYQNNPYQQGPGAEQGYGYGDVSGAFHPCASGQFVLGLLREEETFDEKHRLFGRRCAC